MWKMALFLRKRKMLILFPVNCERTFLFFVKRDLASPLLATVWSLPATSELNFKICYPSRHFPSFVKYYFVVLLTEEIFCVTVLLSVNKTRNKANWGEGGFSLGISFSLHSVYFLYNILQFSKIAFHVGTIFFLSDKLPINKLWWSFNVAKISFDSAWPPRDQEAYSRYFLSLMSLKTFERYLLKITNWIFVTITQRRD